MIKELLMSGVLLAQNTNYNQAELLKEPAAKSWSEHDIDATFSFKVYKDDNYKNYPYI